MPKVISFVAILEFFFYRSPKKKEEEEEVQEEEEGDGIRIPSVQFIGLTNRCRNLNQTNTPAFGQRKLFFLSKNIIRSCSHNHLSTS